MQKLLVTGASGFLGWNLCNLVKRQWKVTGTYCSHPVAISGVKTVKLDLTRFRSLKQLFRETQPDAVIHTAAVTDPDFCEINKETSRKINVDAAAHIARLCADHDIPLVFTSTDLVFDGLNAPYDEPDPVSPVNVYGEQKARAESEVLEQFPKAAVCRMPLMFGFPGPAASSFFQTMVTALRDSKEIRLFTDEYRTPLSAHSSVKGLILAVEKVKGVIHLGGIERISRYHFGMLLSDVLGIDKPAIKGVRQKDVSMKATRPPDVSLNSSRAFDLGFQPRPLNEEVRMLFTTRSRLTE